MALSARVSVVIPNHNRAGLLGHAIRSALTQDPSPLEVLVCDDGSTDESRDVVEAIGDPRVSWLPGTASGGPSRPRNRGIDAARGDLVAFLDSDDVWLPGKLAAQLDLIDSEAQVGCSTNALRWIPRSSTIEGPPKDIDALPRLLDSLPASADLLTLLRRNLVVTSSMVVRTDILRRTGGFPESSSQVFEDYVAWLRVSHFGTIGLLDEPYVIYLDNSEQSFRSTYDVEFTCALNSMIDFFNWRSELLSYRRMGRQEVGNAMKQLSGLLALRDMRGIARGLTQLNRRAVLGDGR